MHFNQNWIPIALLVIVVIVAVVMYTIKTRELNNCNKTVNNVRNQLAKTGNQLSDNTSKLKQAKNVLHTYENVLKSIYEKAIKDGQDKDPNSPKKPQEIKPVAPSRGNNPLKYSWKNDELYKRTERLLDSGCKYVKIVEDVKGKGPTCGASEKDCKGIWNHTGKFTRSGCITGHKVICGRPVCTDSNPEYSDRFNQWWVGTAPACGTDECDCVLEGAIPWRADNKGDGNACTTGQKQLCIKPADANMDGSQQMQPWIEEGIGHCRANNTLDKQFRNMGTEILGNITKGIVKAATGI